MWFKRTLPFVLILGFLFAEKTINRDPQESAEKLYKTMFPAAGVVEHVIWDGNRISTVHGNHGDIASYHITGESGTEWPKGSGKTAIFQSGLWLASGKVRPAGSDQWEEELRTAAAEYTVEFVPGTIDGVTSDGHIYQIHKAELQAFLENDYATYSSMSAMLPRTKIEGNVIFTELEEMQFPTDDFKNWPVEAGAPWVDANGDGIYNIEDGDHPDIKGDMFHWYVMNDGDASSHTALWGTPPMNVEIQTSLFGFDQSGPLGNILFVRWVLINKGSDDLDSVFISMWHDDDVGDHTDDLAGCDTSLSIGYTYNDTDGDVKYGVEVPAVASDFFQGPLVDDPDTSATILTWSLEKGYHLRTIPGKRQLGLTSFAVYTNPSPYGQDPNTAEEAYRFMNGLNGTTGEDFINPITGEVSRFVYTGDPVAGTGWLDNTPGDRRYLMTSGPFYFGSGDTVEVVGSIIIAAGSNWAKSITKMKYYDKFAQGAFKANFDVCSPPSPTVAVSQLDRKIVLTFEEESDRVENYACTGYRFQGYEIYQGESMTGPWHRIATYDVVDGVKLILDWVLDEKTGELLEVPVKFGTDSGIKHYIEITQDVVNNRSLINYRKYFFAVTAYAYDPEAAQRVIESPIQPLTVVPGKPGVGSELKAVYNDVLTVNHASGTAAASFLPIVIDPYQLTNQEYTLSFEQVDSVTNKWVLSEGGQTVLEGTDFPVTEEHFEELKAAGGGVDPTGVYVTNEITEGFILATEGALWDIPGYQNAFVSGDEDTTTNIVFEGVGAPSGSDATWYGFIDYLSGFPQVSAPTLKAPLSDLQRDLEIRFTPDGSIATFMSISILFGVTPIDTIKVPFELWDVENNQQLNAILYSVAGTRPPSLIEVVDSTTHPNSYQFTISVWVVPIYSPYDGKLTAFDPTTDTDKFGWVLKLGTSTQFEYGNVLRVDFANPLIPGTDVYTFKATGLTAVEDAKRQLDEINVFPNPYFGQEPEERNPQDRKVFFTHLGVGTTTIRIFTISGDLVAKIVKKIESENSPDNRAEWNLRNRNGVPVASGMYIAHITVEDLNGKKVGERILKLAIFQPEERLDLF
jgi:hypothetical protein